MERQELRLDSEFNQAEQAGNLIRVQFHETWQFDAFCFIFNACFGLLPFMRVGVICEFGCAVMASTFVHQCMLLQRPSLELHVKFHVTVKKKLERFRTAVHSECIMEQANKVGHFLRT